MPVRPIDRHATWCTLFMCRFCPIDRLSSCYGFGIRHLGLSLYRTEVKTDSLLGSRLCLGRANLVFIEDYFGAPLSAFCTLGPKYESAKDLEVYSPPLSDRRFFTRICHCELIPGAIVPTSRSELSENFGSNSHIGNNHRRWTQSDVAECRKPFLKCASALSSMVSPVGLLRTSSIASSSYW